MVRTKTPRHGSPRKSARSKTPRSKTPRFDAKTPRGSSPPRGPALLLEEYEKSYYEWRKAVSEYHKKPAPNLRRRLTNSLTKAVFGDGDDALEPPPAHNATATAPEPPPATTPEEEEDSGESSDSQAPEAAPAAPSREPSPPGGRPPVAPASRMERRRSVMASMIKEVKRRTEKQKPKYGPAQAMVPPKPYVPVKMDFGMGKLMASRRQLFSAPAAAEPATGPTNATPPAAPAPPAPVLAPSAAAPAVAALPQSPPSPPKPTLDTEAIAKPSATGSAPESGNFFEQLSRRLFGPDAASPMPAPADKPLAGKAANGGSSLPTIGELAA